MPAPVIAWSWWRIALTVLFCLCTLFGVLPLFSGRLQSGCVALITVGLFGTAVCVWLTQSINLWKTLWHTPVGKPLLIVTVALVSALLLLFTVVSVLMITANFRTPPDSATVVVLGAGLRGERPSRILRERLDAATDYLNAHPDAVCIVSGGQGDDEVRTEASVMRDYLLNNGIDDSRIFVEDASTSTNENLEFSRRIIEQNGLPTAIALVTQEFHQCRAQALARKHGFTEIGAVVAHTQWDLLPSYWIRDFAGLCHFALLGR